jgi:serine/threonine protein kinase
VGSIVDGRYLVEARVASGGFGVVYRAQHIHFDAPVALKVFLRVAGGDAVLTANSRGGVPEEARLLFRLAPLHDSFVRIYEVGLIPRDGGGSLHYLAMEWLEGMTLKAHLDALCRRHTGVALVHVIHLLDGVAQGLGIAHAKHITHRDLKPANVFLSVRDREVSAKLLDFGGAKQGLSTRDAHDDTSVAVSTFTPAYGAPEQWQRSLGATGPWTDVYALALLCVELLAGRRWYEDAPSPDWMRLTLDNRYRPTPRARGVEVSDCVEAAFEKALVVDPRGRQANVADFWCELCASAEWVPPRRPISTVELEMDERCAGDAPALKPEPTAVSESTRHSWPGGERCGGARCWATGEAEQRSCAAYGVVVTPTAVPLSRRPGHGLRWMAPVFGLCLIGLAGLGMALKPETSAVVHPRGQEPIPADAQERSGAPSCLGVSAETELVPATTAQLREGPQAVPSAPARPPGPSRRLQRPTSARRVAAPRPLAPAESVKSSRDGDLGHLMLDEALLNRR